MGKRRLMQAGWYWVKYTEGASWVISRWDGLQWEVVVCGMVRYLLPGEFHEIGPRIKEPR